MGERASALSALMVGMGDSNSRPPAPKVAARCPWFGGVRGLEERGDTARFSRVQCVDVCCPKLRSESALREANRNHPNTAIDPGLKEMPEEEGCIQLDGDRRRIKLSWLGQSNAFKHIVLCRVCQVEQEPTFEIAEVEV
jgi:hypothetical protein